MKKRILSGIQPTGQLHIGNYLGAIVQWVKLQEEKAECLYSIVDLHAITVWQDPKELQRNIREVTAAVIASGIDPKQSIIFAQSSVRAHAELAWIMNSVARIGWLNRMTQFKDKVGKHKEKASLGLYAYPCLMAADILTYKATHIPVGEDQKQHLELTRDIAQKFNNDYEVDHFPIVEPLIMGTATRIMSLRDGQRKMGKSDSSDYSRLHLADSNDELALKIRKAKTDPEPLPEKFEDLNDRAEAKNLVNLYAALAEISTEAVCAEFAGKNFSEFKPKLSELVVDRLAPIRDKMQLLLKDTNEIDKILREGAERATAIADPILKETQKIVGLMG